MKALPFSKWLLLILMLPWASCRTGSGGGGSDLNWGHFKDLDLSIDGSIYLFGLSSQDQLHACIATPLPKGVDANWLKAEIYAAVNLWAMTIGRAIPLVFDECKQKPTLRIRFAAAPVRGEFIGYTIFEGGERQIFLNPDYDWEDLGTTLGFGSLPEYKSASWEARAAFVLPILDQGLYPSIKLAKPGPSGKLLQPTFATLLHELGHAFGLCDLYKDASAALDFNGNCSTAHRASKLNADEIMGAGTRPGTARFRLGAEDKIGLKELAKRPGFPNKGWPASSGALSSQQVLERTLPGARGSSNGTADKDTEAANPTASETGNKGFKLEGPTGITAAPGGLTRVTLTVRAPLAVKNAFLWETHGQGPFQQLMESDGAVEGAERVWKVDLELEKSNTAFEYHVSSSQDGQGAVLKFKI